MWIPGTKLRRFGLATGVFLLCAILVAHKALYFNEQLPIIYCRQLFSLQNNPSWSLVIVLVYERETQDRNLKMLPYICTLMNMRSGMGRFELW